MSDKIAVVQRLIWTIFLLAATACGTTSVQREPTPLVLGIPLDEAVYDTRRAQLEPAIEGVARAAEELVNTGVFPGLAVGVVLDGELLWAAGYGVASEAKGTAVGLHSLFRIASITKTVTGLALLQLRDAGRLRLDDPLSQYVPEAGGIIYPTTDSPVIRLRHLITHTSGLPRLGTLDYFTRPDHIVSEDELLGVLKGLALDSVPGTRTSYSNLAVALLGLVIQAASGRGYREYMEEAILRPLGMNDSLWDPTQAATTEGSAEGYARREGAFGPAAPWRMGASEAMGGLYSTLNDMARYVVFQLAAWPARDGPEEGPVRRASVRESHRLAGPAYPGETLFGVGWGLGALPGRDLLVAHTGGTVGYSSCVQMAPHRGLAVIALGNTGNSSAITRWTHQTLLRLLRSIQTTDN